MRNPSMKRYSSIVVCVILSDIRSLLSLDDVIVQYRFPFTVLSILRLYEFVSISCALSIKSVIKLMVAGDRCTSIDRYTEGDSRIDKSKRDDRQFDSNANNVSVCASEATCKPSRFTYNMHRAFHWNSSRATLNKAVAMLHNIVQERCIIAIYE